MNCADVICYITEGEILCNDCAWELPARFNACGEPGHLFDPGWHNCGEIGEDGSPCHIVSSECECEPVFVDSYDFDSPYTCCQCEEQITEP